MFRFNKLVTLTGVAVTLLASPLAAASNLKVVSTFSIISDFAENVGGNRITLTTLVGPNNDAHTYEPRPSDVTAVKNADLVLANGANFEGFLGRLVQASGSTAEVVELTEGIQLLRNTHDDDHDHSNDQHHNDHHHHKNHKHDDKHGGHTDHHHHHDSHAGGHNHSHGEYDPHAWQSVPNARIYVNNIAEAFCSADPGGCPSYRENAKSYDAKLITLEKELESLVSEIPLDKRTAITSHDAFGYLAQEYGFQFLAPQGASTGSEASAQTVAKLIQQIKQQQASALFVENISNPQLIQQIASETGMKVGGKLYSDALSTEDGDAATYIDMMRHNISTIRDTILNQ